MSKKTAKSPLNYYSEMIPTLADRAGSGALSSFGFSNPPLRAYLKQQFHKAIGEDGSFIGDPAFEAVFGWKSHDKKIEELEGNLLHPKLIQALDSDESDLKKHFKPYLHQEISWRILSDKTPKSVIISSGTGSGKTECFMIPILNRLIEEREQKKRQLKGVRTLFLYPLNALINSQRERLNTWTKPFGKDIRFCLYNGLTPERKKAEEKRETPNQVIDRETLRENPPPILVTNPTMLEYMLVRAKDNPIIEQSQGLLDTIVLDEAHTYIGSQAAEMTLLLRRVLHAFGKKPSEVRFVATSATIGEEGEKAQKKLKKFLQQIAGVDPKNVHVVEGNRDIPSLKLSESKNTTLTQLQEIEDPDELYQELEKNKTARQIRSLFTNSNDVVTKLSNICSEVYKGNTTFSLDQQKKALSWLDLLTSAVRKDGKAFLPVRAHIFQKTFAGIWACADKNCSAKDSVLQSNQWLFGQVYLQNQSKCKCDAPVYEVVSCKECGEIYLDIERTSDDKIIQPARDENFDEFELEVDDDPEILDEEREVLYRTGNEGLITNKKSDNTGTVYINKETRELHFDQVDNSIEVEIREYQDEPNGLPCPNCQDSSKIKYKRFRGHTIGAPSMLNVLLPTLLEYAQSGNESPALPFNGRRLLTFNDSRQGTARIAAKLQQDSERNKARGLIYHYVLRDGMQTNYAEVKEIEERIKKLKQVPEADFVSDLIEKDQNKLNELKSFSPVHYNKLKSNIAKEDGDFRHIITRYNKYDPFLFSNDSVRHNVAELLIFREFARRPRRQNNLETLGLVTLDYPSIDSISSAPSEWGTKGLSLLEWKTYLKICIDYFVRAGGSTEGSNQYLEYWLGLPFYKSYLIAQDEETGSSYQRKWPTAKRGKNQSRIVRLLIKLLGVDPDTAEGEDIIDEVLERAWYDLTRNTQTLKRKDSGYILELSNVSFTIPEKVWICPITRRFLDKTIRGITPYLPKTLDGNIVCKEHSIPRYPEPFGNTQDPFKNRELAQEWIRQQEEIESLKNEGYWSLFNDRVIEYMPYYEAAEHSAQIDSNLLQRYEKQFKEGRINILSCSTTMEMGIDIGGIRMVGMNNLPPHPANYLQRAGRAGRRNETRSTTMTLCKQNPHDLTAFEESKWAFETKLPAPTVSLQSRIIVQRHVNAFVLSYYLNNVIGFKEVDKLKLSTGWFYLDKDQGITKFIRWLETLDGDESDQFSEGVNLLVRKSALDGLSLASIYENVITQIDEVFSKWKKEHDNIENQKQELLEKGKADSPEVKAIGHQLKRLTDEYLLREFASKGFLPGYGFPSNIVAFDHYNMSAYKQDKRRKKTKTRDDNVQMSRDLPSRDIVTALREYAPGADVVLDGAVYRSEGITLNWHVPSSVKDVKESQAIKYAWRCHKCGFSGSTYDMHSAFICEECGSKIKSSDIEHYLEPAGFSVDFNSSIHNDITSQTYIPIEKPWIQAHGSWVPLLNPTLGKYRTTTSGNIFNFSKGIHSEGYALCLMCGRSEPMDKDGKLPKKFQKGNTHKKLRGGSDSSNVCPGSKIDFAIKKGIALGYQNSTDILQVVLKDVHGDWLVNKNIAATLAIVLRDSLAELLGIQNQELICDVQQAKVDGRLTESILIFDKNSSGFSSNSGHLINRMLEEARKQLMCPKNCKSSCPNCVMDYDQRFREDELDRHLALQFLTPEWVEKNKLPSKLDYFDGKSEIEQESIFSGLIRELENTIEHSKVVQLFLKGDVNEFDLSNSNIRQTAQKLAYNKGVEVDINIDAPCYDKLSAEDRFVISSLLGIEKVNLYKVSSLPTFKDALPIAAIKSSNNSHYWVSEHPKIIEGNEGWGIIDDEKSPIVHADCEVKLTRNQVSLSEIKESLKGQADLEISIQDELNTRLHDFGERFWEFIAEQHDESKSNLFNSQLFIKRVEYSDRYLYNPLSLGLVHSVIDGLRKLIGDNRWGNASVQINTANNSNNMRPGNLIFHDWMESNDRDAVFEYLFQKSNLKLDLNVQDRRYLEHGRAFKVIFDNISSLTIRLDQGVGYWRVENPRYSNRRTTRENTTFEFKSVNMGETGLEQEASQIIDKNPLLVGNNYPTQIFIKYRST